MTSKIVVTRRDDKNQQVQHFSLNHQSHTWTFVLHVNELSCCPLLGSVKLKQMLDQFRGFLFLEYGYVIDREQFIFSRIRA